MRTSGTASVQRSAFSAPLLSMRCNPAATKSRNGPKPPRGAVAQPAPLRSHRTTCPPMHGRSISSCDKNGQYLWHVTEIAVIYSINNHAVCRVVVHLLCLNLLQKPEIGLAEVERQSSKVFLKSAVIYSDVPT